MKRVWICCIMGLLLFIGTGCGQIIRSGEEQIGGLVRLLFSPANVLLEEVQRVGKDPDFRMSHGDMVFEYPHEDLDEYTYSMKVTGIDSVGRTVKFVATAEVQNPRHLSKLPLEVLTPIMSEAECPEQLSCPEVIMPSVPETRASSQVACAQNPDVITLITWLKAVGRTDFTPCQKIIDEDTGQSYVVEILYDDARCAVTLEQGTNAEVWAKHDTLREHGITVIPLYPADFLNTISGSQQSVLGKIDECVYHVLPVEDPS